MPKVSPEHMQARRDQITRAAVEEFSRRGIHSTSMANIIAASGLSAGAIYTHFAGKHEIIAHVAQTTFHGLFSGVETIANTEPIPSPTELVNLISTSITDAQIPSGMIVQIWGEAATNPDVRAAVNMVYTRALEVLREYSVLWLITSEGTPRLSAQRRAVGHARILVSIIYAQILQMSLIEGYDAQVLTSEIEELLAPETDQT